MRRFTRLYLDLDATTSTSRKQALLEAYLRAAPPEDAAWAVAVLTGNRPRGTASSRALRAAVEDRSGYPAWLIDACRAATGDAAEAYALLVPDPDDPEPPGLRELVERSVLPLVSATDDERRRILLDAWTRLDADERFVYHKLIRGAFRVGVQKRTVERAIAGVAGLDLAVVARRMTGRFEPTPEALAALLAPADAEDRARRPYPFFLAHQLDDDPAALGPASEWLAEWKWDGVRAQLMRRSGETALWSRGEEIITHQFPELAAAAAALPDGTVLDGEILLWRGEAPAPFAALQTRLQRTAAPPAGLFDVDRARMLVFDLLEADGVDLRSIPLRERRRRLEDVVRRIDDDAIAPSPLVAAADWDELAAARATARERRVEGLMLKHRASVYGVGRTKPASGEGWWKWKVAPHTVDAVMVHAFLGTGRRASLYTDYAFAVWDAEGGERTLTTFTRAYSGLTQEEIERLDAWIRRHTISSRGPLRIVEPEQVFEIAFEGVQPSARHKAGIALRFPRIARWRRDKSPAEADDLASLLKLADPPAAPGD